MTSKSKAKGTYHEKWFVDLFKGWGLEVKRQPLSGSLGGEYSGDLVIKIGGDEYIAEVKYRKKGGFPSPFTVLKNRDIALFKTGATGEDAKDMPRWVLVVPDRIVEKQILEKINEHQSKN